MRGVQASRELTISRCHGGWIGDLPLKPPVHHSNFCTGRFKRALIMPRWGEIIDKNCSLTRPRPLYLYHRPGSSHSRCLPPPPCHGSWRLYKASHKSTRSVAWRLSMKQQREVRRLRWGSQRGGHVVSRNASFTQINWLLIRDNISQPKLDCLMVKKFGFRFYSRYLFEDFRRRCTEWHRYWMVFDNASFTQTNLLVVKLMEIRLISSEIPFG